MENKGWNPDVSKSPELTDKYYPGIGRILSIRRFLIDGHEIIQAHIERSQNSFWPDKFTWIDGIEWPYRDKLLKGHSRFPKSDRIRKIIKELKNESSRSK